MKFYEVVRHNRRLKSEQTPFYRGGKIGKISFFIAVPKFAKSPFYGSVKISLRASRARSLASFRLTLPK